MSFISNYFAIYSSYPTAKGCRTADWLSCLYLPLTFVAIFCINFIIAINYIEVQKWQQNVFIIEIDLQVTFGTTLQNYKLKMPSSGHRWCTDEAECVIAYFELCGRFLNAKINWSVRIFGHWSIALVTHSASQVHRLDAVHSASSAMCIQYTLSRAGHFRHFLIFSIIKNIFFHFLSSSFDWEWAF